MPVLGVLGFRVSDARGVESKAVNPKTETPAFRVGCFLFHMSKEDLA